jgi:hypothetical protein
MLGLLLPRDSYFDYVSLQIRTGQAVLILLRIWQVLT